MFGIKGFDKKRCLIVVSGTPSSGKTKIANLIQDSSDIQRFSVEDYLVLAYRNNCYADLFEKEILTNFAIANFKLDLAKHMQTGLSVIIDYTFNDTWTKRLYDYCYQYDYNITVVNCKFSSFNKLWDTYRLRYPNKDISLRCVKFTQQEMILDDYPMSERYRYELRRMYNSDVYNRIKGDNAYSSKYIWSLLSGRNYSERNAI